VTTVWVTIGLLALAGALIKASGPLVLGRRELPPPVRDGIGFLAPALLAALVAVQTVGGDRALVVDERLAAVAVAGAALALRVPLLGAIALAALTAAGLRAL